MNKYKRLAGNSILFAIGNLGSKLITFFMLPLYTWRMSQADFGVSDLVSTTVSLLLPVVSLSIFESVLRFSLESKSNKVSILSNSMVITFFGTIILLLVIPITTLLRINYGIYVVLILIAQMYQTLFSQYAKAVDKVKIYAVNGIILSFLTAILNVLFLLVLNWGVTGYLLSILIATFISNVWLWTVLKLFKSIDFSTLSKEEIKMLLKYSIPLIPNTIAWWATSAISRYFILYFIGTAANGLFAVANKIPTILNVLNTIFFQAWQLSAIEEFESKDSSEFYSKIFSFYSKFLFIGMSSILVILKPLMSLLVSESFFLAWQYVPFLLLAVIYSSFSSFLGSYYAATKQTKSAFTTTIYAAFINIVGNLILIPNLGLNGAGISSAISFFCLWIIRYKDTKRFIPTELDVSNLIQNHAIIFFQIIMLYYFNGTSLILVEVFSFGIILFFNKQLLINFLNFFTNKKV